MRARLAFNGLSINSRIAAKTFSSFESISGIVCFVDIRRALPFMTQVTFIQSRKD